jgi:hypothetical protein
MISHKAIVFLSFCALLLCFVSNDWAREHSNRLPKFEDYRIKDVFAGTIAAPIISASIDQRDAEAIRDGVDKGWGVFHGFEERKGPNFAGRFILIHWGCGTTCMEMAVVDAKSGDVYFPPITDEGINVQSCFLPFLTYPDDGSRSPILQYRLDSKLFIIKCNDGPTELSYTFYFLWEKNRWTLLRKVPMKRR